MPIPPDFQFSQNNLQDYVDCPRRFQLRYLLRQRWPALQSQPVLEQEKHMKQGDRFHHMVYQSQCGIPAEALTCANTDLALEMWWHNYLAYPLQNLPQQRYPEFTLSAPFAGHRLVAKYDLLAVDPGRQIVIVDWKTSRKRPARAYLAQRLQTRLYPLMAVLAGMRMTGGLDVFPEQVTMIYWFASSPTDPEIFHYDQEQFEADRQEIYRLITQVASTTEKTFFLTTLERTCTYCTYRSMCGRGNMAGDWNAWDEDDIDGQPDTLDFTSIGEIHF
jgi:CRISPR/Cas system-associated exonuclease Cas4 (RecB family)